MTGPKTEIQVFVILEFIKYTWEMVWILEVKGQMLK